MPRRKHNDLAAQEWLARRIRQARVQKGMTQQELAEEVDAAVQTVSRWESAKLWPSLPTIYRLAKIFDVEAEFLIGKGPAGLSSKESEVVESWRQLDAEGQRWILGLLRWASGGSRPLNANPASSYERPASP